MGDGVKKAEGHDARAGWRVGAHDETIESAKLLCKAGAQQYGSQVAGGTNLQRHSAFSDDPLKIRVGHCRRTAVNVKRYVRLHGEQMVAGDRTRARNGGAAGVASGYQARSLGLVNKRHIVVCGLDGAEAGLGQRYALGRQLPEIGSGKAGLQNNRARNNLHAARAVLCKTTLCRNRQGLDALGIVRAAGNMHL